MISTVIPVDQHVYVSGNPFVVIGRRDTTNCTLIKVRWVDDRVVEEIGVKRLEELVRYSAGFGHIKGHHRTPTS